MRALCLLVAALAIAGCDDHADTCPAFPYNDLRCSTEGQVCTASRGPCTCQGGVFDCPGEFPMVHDMAVPDLSMRDLAPQPAD